LQDRPASRKTGYNGGLRQLTLPFEWQTDTILPPRQTTSLADLAFD
jgi:hypothetical protein